MRKPDKRGKQKQAPESAPVLNFAHYNPVTNKKQVQLAPKLFPSMMMPILC